MSLLPQVCVPAGKSGAWEVHTVTVDRMIWTPANLRRPIFAGTYTVLSQNSLPWMSDTTSERDDHEPAVLFVKGLKRPVRCLVTGLGLGVIVQALLLMEHVQEVRVVELSEDVIKLVAPHYQERFGERFRVEHASAFDWTPPPGTKYDLIWHDIWQQGGTCADEMMLLKKRYRRYLARGGMQKCWQERLAYTLARDKAAWERSRQRVANGIAWK